MNHHDEETRRAKYSARKLNLTPHVCTLTAGVCTKCRNEANRLRFVESADNYLATVAFAKQGRMPRRG